MMETQTSEAAPFGERLFEASCKVNTPPAQSQVDAVAEVWTLGLVVRPLSENTVDTIITAGNMNQI